MSDKKANQRRKKAERLASDCYVFAREFIAFQTLCLRDAVALYNAGNKKPTYNQKEMGQMASSVRNAQAIGNLALGEAQSSEKKQLELDLGEQARNLGYDELVDRLKRSATTEPIRGILADALGHAASEAL